jgi:hypothetical protein
VRRAAILLGVPLLLAALAAIPLGLWRGEYQWLCAAVAAAVVVPPGVLTLLASGPLARSSPMGPLLVLVVGTFGRIALGFGGAAAVYFASKPTFHADPISYWAWVLGMYLATLAVETALLARGNPPAAATGQPKS